MAARETALFKAHCGTERNNTRGKRRSSKSDEVRCGHSRFSLARKCFISEAAASDWDPGPCNPWMKRDRHGANEERVFAHRLLSAAPTRIAAQVGVGAGPHHNSAEVEDRVLEVVTSLFPFEGADLFSSARESQVSPSPLFPAERVRGGQRLTTARVPTSPDHRAPGPCKPSASSDSTS